MDFLNESQIIISLETKENVENHVAPSLLAVLIKGIRMNF